MDILKKPLSQLISLALLFAFLINPVVAGRKEAAESLLGRGQFALMMIGFFVVVFLIYEFLIKKK